MENILWSTRNRRRALIPRTTRQDKKKADVGQTGPVWQTILRLIIYSGSACLILWLAFYYLGSVWQTKWREFFFHGIFVLILLFAFKYHGPGLLTSNVKYTSAYNLPWLATSTKQSAYNLPWLAASTKQSAYRQPWWAASTERSDEDSHLELPVSVQTSAPVIHGTKVLQSAGVYEVELNREGDPELHNLKRHCRKNPGHNNFIPVNEFDKEHLPALYRNDLMIELVKCLSTLTVRLRVDKISLSRPSPPYPPNPRRDHLGRDCSINGTGHVTSTVVYSEATDITCACPQCLESGNPVRRFAKIFIQTAAHVVHDDLEAANTTCYFNYLNDIDGLDTAVKVQGTKGVKIDVKEDRCWMYGYTHDLSLGKKLGFMSDNYQRLRREVRDKYCVNWSDTPEDKLTIIVSHPHGCSKYVTVGNTQDRLAAPDDEDWTQYSYTTPTCPGSSGAPIFMLGKHGYIDNHHHSGAVPDTGLNVSTFGLF